MNSTSSRKNYGTLDLATAAPAGLQLEWAMVENPTPRARFTNFPFADQAPVTPVTQLPQVHSEKRPLAA